MGRSKTDLTRTQDWGRERTTGLTEQKRREQKDGGVGEHQYWMENQARSNGDKENEQKTGQITRRKEWVLKF